MHTSFRELGMEVRRDSCAWGHMFNEDGFLPIVLGCRFFNVEAAPSTLKTVFGSHIEEVK